ncbi:probable serine carboxypeptidase CPVL [Caerostris extrusa]|uniref:Carboxypeptidase n=1 Tax=Caerostris extrusa TaxID=172846 RepID=A0AAV4PFL2_CAEEX|nr:probable serine carboxypeptidase CPVL [Caerostris extrusa]
MSVKRGEQEKYGKRMALAIVIIAAIIGQIAAVGYRTSPNVHVKEQIISTRDVGDPLFLTKYIASGDFETAKNLSKTGLLPNAPEVLSYSGFITVNRWFQSNIFFWFFPSLNKDTKAPILLWLQGGPGISGLFGFFVENGPYVLDANMNAKIRDHNWAENFQIIYVDNPVGTGFSFTEDSKGYVRNQEEMAEDMYEFLQQFFTLFSEYQNNDFYITGESYAGKYIPALAYKIHTMGSDSKIKLTGVAIGNGMCDPETMMDYGTYLYNIGLVDEKQANEMKNLSYSIVNHIREEEYFDAVVEMDKLIISFSILPYTSLFKNFTDMDFYYNYLISETPKDFAYFSDYVNTPQFRWALHVGDFPFQNGKLVQKYLLLDIMKSVKPQVAVIMDNYRVMFYNGQLDIIIPYPLTLNFLKTVKWKYAEEYKQSKRHIWRLKDSKEIAGYVHDVGDFYEILVRNAGHILPYDKPKVAFDLISRFVNKIPFY